MSRYRLRVASVAVAAVVTGGAFAAVLGARDVNDGAAALGSNGPSPHLTASPSPSITPAPSATPSASPSPSPSPTSTAFIASTQSPGPVAAPTSTPAPASHEAAPPPPVAVWEAQPRRSGSSVTDAALLTDGRIAVAQCCGSEDGLNILDPATTSWSKVPEVGPFGSYSQIAVGTDGRVFTAAVNLLENHEELLITGWDPDDGWRMGTVLSLLDEFGYHALEANVVALDDGLLYVPERTAGSRQSSQLLVVDPATGEVTRSAPVSAPGASVATADGTHVYIARFDQDPTPIWRYDPQRDGWTEYAPAPPVEWPNHYGAVVDDEGRYWLTGNRSLWVFDPLEGSWRWVNTPEGATGDALALSDDQQLYLFDSSGNTWKLTGFE